MEKNKKLPPVWVLCDASDEPGTIYMGCETSSHNEQNLVETFRVTTEGISKLRTSRL